jgi:hypothetical protein
MGIFLCHTVVIVSPKVPSRCFWRRVQTGIFIAAVQVERRQIYCRKRSSLANLRKINSRKKNVFLQVIEKIFKCLNPVVLTALTLKPSWLEHFATVFKLLIGLPKLPVKFSS